MSALLLSPHNDDAELFAAFTCIRHRPRVVVVVRSTVQERRGCGVTAAQREVETDQAMRILGCEWEQWPFPDDVADWAAVEKRLAEVDRVEAWEVVFAPLPEASGGHAHHDAVGILAARVFGDRVIHYLTYSEQRGKSRDGLAVRFEDPWVELKLRALACHRSQFLPKTGCAEHFLRDQHEFYAFTDEDERIAALARGDA